MKRAIGAVSMVLMLHLSLVGADQVCAKHRSSKSSPVPSMAGHHHAPAEMPSPHGDKQKCDTPVSPDCCTALTSCAMTLTLESRERTDVDEGHTAQPTDRVEPASSRAAAPEPPPPRA